MFSISQKAAIHQPHLHYALQNTTFEYRVCKHVTQIEVRMESYSCGRSKQLIDLLFGF